MDITDIHSFWFVLLKADLVTYIQELDFRENQPANWAVTGTKNKILPNLRRVGLYALI